MIAGEITAAREAVVNLTVRGPHSDEMEVETVIDTGFTEALALPRSMIASLRLPYQHSTPVVLADGGIVMCAVHKASLAWDGKDRIVLVHQVEGGALLGMSLLYGSRVTLDVVDGGDVTIEPLP